MIDLKTNPRPVRVGHWHIEHAKAIQASKFSEGKYIPRIKEVRYDYEGLLHGFGVEGEHEEMYCFALVEKPDGTFDTPSVTVIQLITPTTP